MIECEHGAMFCQTCALKRIEELERERERAEWLITNKQNAVDAYVDRVLLLEGILARERQCSTCCGTPHASGLPCICGGTNKAEDEVKNLRLESMVLRDAVVRMGEELKKFERKCEHGDPLPMLSSGWCWCGRGMRAEARVEQLEAALREIAMLDYEGPIVPGSYLEIARAVLSSKAAAR